MPVVVPVVRDATTGLVRNIQAGETMTVFAALADVRQGTSGEASAAMTAGMPVIINSSSKHVRAIATSVAAGKALALVLDPSIPANGTGNFLFNGILSLTTAQWDAIAGTTGGLTPGQDYFLSATTAGNLTATPPTTAGSTVITKLGTALSATDLGVAPQAPFLN